MQHYAVADYLERRVMHRATIARPVARLDGFDYERRAPVRAGRGRAVHATHARRAARRHLPASVPRPFGLRFIDYSVLRVLRARREPHRMSPTELTEIVVRSSGGMTQILDRVERGGLVERSADPPTAGRCWWA